MGTQYSLTCINNSSLLGSFAVFQLAPPLTIPANVFSLAWFARAAHPDTQVTFEWTVNYSFVWSETGTLKPGITFDASQTVPADPLGANMTQLTEDTYGATYFTPPTNDGAIGSLTIQQLANVVPNRTAIGVGISNSATFAIQASPNMTAVFTPHPNYWVMFGNYETGQVIDVENVTGEIEVTYAGSLTSRTVTLGPDNILRLG
jgi:rhizosphere induced protein